jgi:cytochrome c-type biogenesis protein
MLSSPGRRPHAAVRARGIAAWVAALLALGLAIGASLATGPSGGALVLAVSTISGELGAPLQDLADAVPFAYAFAAGMASALNPCGIALLPAYLGLYLGDSYARPAARSVAHAVLIGATMTVGFIALFAIVGLALTGTLAMLGARVAWIGVVVGIVLIGTGGRILAGNPVYAAGPERLGARLGPVASRPGLAGYAAYGAIFALSSLGCTLPLFLTVVGTTMTASGTSSIGQFLFYALGMGFMVTGLTVLASLFGRTLFKHAAGMGRYAQPASAVLLLLTGAYVVHYWLTAGLVG